MKLQMTGCDDMELVQKYAATRSEEAFAILVSRYINLVYSVALRHVANTHQAEEISQTVFLILARKAVTLRKSTVLSGWLYSTARLTAANYLRSELRRTRREQEAHMQSLVDESEAETWKRVAPLLDQALADLNAKDRDAIALRFFGAKSFAQVGIQLGSTEAAAKMRVNRAVEKLRKLLAQKGVALTTAALCGAVSAHAVQAAPLALASSITASVVQGSATSAALATLAKTTINIMAWTKAKTATAIAVGVLLATGTATVTVKTLRDSRTDPWQARNINTATLKEVAPQVRIVPTQHPEFAGWGMSGDKVLGIGQTPQTILLIAYGGKSPSRIISTAKPPEGQFDFIANLPENSLLALQREAKRKFGLTARRDTREADVLRLVVKNPKAEGLRPSESEGGSSRSGAGQFSCLNQPLSCLTSMLERYFQLPVVDGTGLEGRFDIDLNWDQPDLQHESRDALKQAILDELGLELIPAREQVEMLIVEQAR